MVMLKISVIDWQSYPSRCDTLFSVYSIHACWRPSSMVTYLWGHELSVMTGTNQPTNFTMDSTRTHDRSLCDTSYDIFISSSSKKSLWCFCFVLLCFYLFCFWSLFVCLAVFYLLIVWIKDKQTKQKNLNLNLYQRKTLLTLHWYYSFSFDLYHGKITITTHLKLIFFRKNVEFTLKLFWSSPYLNMIFTYS